MRSGSTLLLHLLMTNPEVSALGERNAVYANRTDLVRLAMAARRANRAPFQRLRYVADQLNHNQFTPNSALLCDPRVRILFIVRQPEASLGSLLELSRTYYQEAWSPARAVEYYEQRLEALIGIGECLPSSTQAALVKYEALIQTPDETLEGLRQFLALRQGFSKTYDIYPFTSTRGDPGPNITAGRIVRKGPSAHTYLSAADLERAVKAYERCAGALARFAVPPSGTPGEQSVVSACEPPGATRA